MEYQAIVVKRSITSNPTPESRYWRQFKYPVFFKEYAPITSLHFSPSKPHRYAVTAATRVQIYAPRTQKITKTISRFKDVARSGCIREDGKLLVAGDDSGLIQVTVYIQIPSIMKNIVLTAFVRFSMSILVRFFAPWIPTSSPSMLPNFLLYHPFTSCLVLMIQRRSFGICHHRRRSRPLRAMQIMFVLAKYRHQILM